MKQIIRTLMGLFFLITACTPAERQVVQVTRLVTPTPLPSPQPTPFLVEGDLAAFVAGQQAFAFDLYHGLPAENNMFFSPYSIYTGLAMLSGGAGGDTREQMRDALHISLPDDRFHATGAAMTQGIRQWAASANVEGGFQLQAANGLWGQNDFPFNPSFLSLMEAGYGTGLQQVDFTSEPELARQEINQWASDRTAGRIKNLLPDKSVTPVTRLVLANAVYLNAAWQHPFSVSSIREEPFYPLQGEPVSMPMMHKTHRFRYGEADGIQAVILPYRGGRMGMVILLPAPGTFAAVAAELTPETLDSLFTDFTEVRLTFPRFTLDAGSLSMRPLLTSLGIEKAFSETQADFSGIGAEPGEIRLEDVFHQAFVSVNEEGTEAAAATAAVVVTRVVAEVEPEPPVEMRVDRPFIFLIQDLETELILFAGQVVQPVAPGNG